MAKLSPDYIKWVLTLNAKQAQEEYHKTSISGGVSNPLIILNIDSAAIANDSVTEVPTRFELV